MRLRGRRIAATLAAVMSVALIAASAATAEVVTIGSPLTGAHEDYEFCIPLCISSNVQLDEPGANVTVPADGTLTTLRTLDGSGRYRVRVLRKEALGDYELAGTGSIVDPIGIGLETFAIDVPVKAGDLIGLEGLETTDRLATMEGDNGSKRRTDFFEFKTQPPPPDGLKLLQPDFVTEEYPHQENGFDVQMGTAPEVAPTPPPPTPTPTPAPIVPAPIAKAAQCKVPKLKGKKLAAAKKAIRAADCKLGKVTTEQDAGHPPKVVGQSPAAGKARAAAAKVAVVLG